MFVEKMIPKEFLEEYSLFRKFKLPGINNDLRKWQKTSISMVCPTCNSHQTFTMVNEFDRNQSGSVWATNMVLILKYLCQGCGKFQREFFVYINDTSDTIYKVGQYPEWEIKVEKKLENTLKEHSVLFKRGLVCESQGYGIGAFAYYRRITENIIDDLLESIYELIDSADKQKYKSALDKTKKTRVAQEKIELIKDLLPSILKPNGINPLQVLHSELSKGLHSETDENCLEISGHIKTVLIFLITQILQSQESMREFTHSMKSILGKKK